MRQSAALLGHQRPGTSSSPESVAMLASAAAPGPGFDRGGHHGPSGEDDDDEHGVHKDHRNLAMGALTPGSSPLSPTTMAPAVYSTAFTAYLIGANVVTSVAIVLVNKRVLAVFPRAVILTLLHQAFCWLVTSLMVWSGTLAVPPAAAANRRAAALAGATNVLGLYLMNVSLSVNSVGVYQLSKLACLPVIGMLQTVLYRAPVPPTAHLVSLTIVMLGVVLSTQKDFRTHPAGLMVSTVAVILTSLSQVTIQHLPSFRGLNGMQTVALMSPYSTGVLAVLVAFIDLPQMVFSPDSTGQSLGAQLAAAPWGYVAVSCVLALGANYYGNSIISATSAITFNLVGHLKTVLIVVAGAVFSPAANDLGVAKVLGMAVSMTGMGAYTWLKNTGDRGLAWVHAHRTLLALGGSLAGMVVLLIASSSGGGPSPVDALPPSMLASMSSDSPAISVADLATVFWRAVDHPSVPVQLSPTTPARPVTFQWSRFTPTPPPSPITAAPTTPPPPSANSVVVLVAESSSATANATTKSEAAAMQHALWWAVRHGYDFRRVRTDVPPGHHPSWARVRAVADAVLRGAGTVVSLSPGAVVARPWRSANDVMVEWGMGSIGGVGGAWIGISPAPIVDSAETDGSMERRAAATAEVGADLWIVRGTPAARAAMARLVACVDHVPLCAKWANRAPYAAGAWTEFVKPYYRLGTDVADPPLCTLPSSSSVPNNQLKANAAAAVGPRRGAPLAPECAVAAHWSAAKVHASILAEHLKVVDRLMVGHVARCRAPADGHHHDAHAPHVRDDGLCAPAEE
ncbi:hypothetical protein BC828DRAFT_403819 [Blastocladiella britannica]|nr:hypothetical protein BC828DRAFT_403819 [Blastocladiella britannica]